MLIGANRVNHPSLPRTSSSTGSPPSSATWLITTVQPGRAQCHTSSTHRTLLTSTYAADPKRREGNAFSAGNDRADLWRRLWWEAATLRGVYQGISAATQALREHNRLMEGRCRSPLLDGAAAQQQADVDPAAVAAGIANAHGRVAAIIVELSTSIAEVARDPKGRGYVAGLKSLASRLSSWERILASMSMAPADPMLGVSSVEIRYCFPFAVNIDPERLQAFHPDLERHSFAARLDDLPAAATLPSASRLAELVGDKLVALGQGAMPRARSIRLTEFWNGAGNGLFGGVRVTLPDLIDGDHPEDRWRTWIDLSRIENHCLCIERTVTNPTPNEVYAALQAVAHYATDRAFRYRWAGDDDVTRPKTSEGVEASCLRSRKILLLQGFPSMWQICRVRSLGGFE